MGTGLAGILLAAGLTFAAFSLGKRGNSGKWVFLIKISFFRTRYKLVAKGSTFVEFSLFQLLMVNNSKKKC